MSRERHGSEPARTDGGTAQATWFGGSSEVGDWASFGVATYLVVALGTAATVFLVQLIGSALGTGGGRTVGTALQVGVGEGFQLIYILGALIAVGLGILIARNAGAGESAPTAGAISAGAGVLVAAAVMIVLAILLDTGAFSGGADDVAGEVGGLIGLTIGAAVAGAAAAAVGERTID